MPRIPNKKVAVTPKPPLKQMAPYPTTARNTRVICDRKTSQPAGERAKEEKNTVVKGASIAPPKTSAGATLASGVGQGEARAHIVGKLCAIQETSHVTTTMAVAGSTSLRRAVVTLQSALSAQVAMFGTSAFP